MSVFGFCFFFLAKLGGDGDISSPSHVFLRTLRKTHNQTIKLTPGPDGTAEREHVPTHNPSDDYLCNTTARHLTAVSNLTV